ncbi:FMN-binding negative transcriptional regulator, partial [Pseudoalteromonas undina]
PVLSEPSRNIFLAHVAKNNPLRHSDKHSEKLLFNGDNCYLSRSYSNNKTVPSWLYA